MGGRARRAVLTTGAVGQRRRRGRRRPQRPRRGHGARAGPLVLLPLHGRERGEPDRPHAHGSGRHGDARTPALRVRLLPQLRARLLRRPPSRGRRGARPHGLPRRLHLRVDLRHRAAPHPRRRRGADARRVPDPPRPVQDRPGSPAAPRRRALAGHVGRPRGRQQLRARPLGESRSAVPDPPRGRVPRLLRAHAAAGDGPACRRRDASPRALRHRHAGALPRPRRPAVPHAAGVPAARPRRLPARRPPLPGAVRARPHDAGHGAGALARERRARRPGPVEPPGPADRGRAHGQGLQRPPALGHGQLGRLPRGSQPAARCARTTTASAAAWC